jgi:rod shape-determining protein MreC
MQAILRRYRDLTVLAVVVLSQLVLLGSQVRGEEGVPLVRRWAVSAVVPFAKAFAMVRNGTIGSLSDIFALLNARSENQQLKKDNDRLKLENQYLKSELGTADRGKALSAFQQRSQSKVLAARLIGSNLGTNTKTIFIDRGSGDGVKKGMAVITPDGIVGKVIAAFPAAAQVMLITDPAFAAGVISGKNRLTGTLRGDGSSMVRVDYLPTEAKVTRDEWFYTSGDDRVFPRGLPVGRVTVSDRGRDFRDVKLAPSGLQGGFEEVLVVINGVHELLPEDNPGQPSTGSPAGSNDASQLLPSPDNPADPATVVAPPPDATLTTPAAPVPAAAMRTDADRLLDRYRKIGEAQGHKYGSGRAPDFNAPITPSAPGPGATATGTATPGVAPNPAVPNPKPGAVAVPPRQ